jgi:hypothetical protein
MANSLEDNVSHISFVSQNNVGHDKQKLCVYEQNEINYQGNQRSMPSPTLTIYDNELPKRNNIVGSTMKINQSRQQCIMSETKASFIETPNSAIIIKDQQQSKLQVALSNKKAKEKANLTEWLARLPLIDDDNSIKSPAFKNDTIDKNKSDMCKMTSTKQPSLDTLPPTRPSLQVSEWLARLPLIDDDNSTKSRAFKNNTTDKNKSDMRKRTSTQQPFPHNRSQGSQSCQSPFPKRRRIRRPPYPRYSRRSRMKEWLTYLDFVRQVMRSNSFPKPNQYPILPAIQ